MILIEYPKCSTCKRAKKFLDDNSIKYIERNIKDENPTKDELKDFIFRSGKEINKLFNTSGVSYRENNLKEKIKLMTNEEKIELLSTDGMLVKRPILITNEKVFIGFNEKEWNIIKLDTK